MTKTIAAVLLVAAGCAGTTKLPTSSPAVTGDPLERESQAALSRCLATRATSDSCLAVAIDPSRLTVDVKSLVVTVDQQPMLLDAKASPAPLFIGSMPAGPHIIRVTGTSQDTGITLRSDIDLLPGEQTSWIIRSGMHDVPTADTIADLASR